MPQIQVLHDLVIIFGFSIGVVLVFQRLHLPAIIGFLISGALLGPYGWNLVDDLEQVKVLAEVGVVMLLFTIGLEFSLRRLLKLRTFVLTGGGLQVGITILLTAAAAFSLGMPITAGVFWGFLLALSSTAIVLRILTDRNELDSPHGRLAVGILIFQDLIVVPMMLITPVLSGSTVETPISILWTLVKSVLLLGGVLVAAFWVVPKALVLVVRGRTREIFVIAVILICLGIAWVTSMIGLSLAIGAFIAGLVISESEFGHQALADIIPFRDSFNSLFFVSIGMLFDFRLLLERPLFILGMVLLVLLMKGLICGGITMGLGYPLRVAALLGLSLPQVGEFSFVLAEVGEELGLLDAQGYQLFLAISILSMVATPFLIQAGPRFSRQADSFQRLQQWFGKRRLQDLEPPDLSLRDHVIIAGFGLNGRSLARVLKESAIPYVVIDLHGEVVSHGRIQGEPIYFGDVTRMEVLHHLRIKEAKVLVVAVSDPFALRRAISVARQANPRVHIVVRTRYVRDLEDLFRLGANEVVPEEFETSLAILSMVLNQFNVPPSQIARRKEDFRREGYARLSQLDVEPYMVDGSLPPEVEVMRHRIPDDSPAIGKSLAKLSLPIKTGAMVVAVIRGEDTRSNPGGSFILEPHDIVVLVGIQEEINRAIIYLAEGERPSEGEGDGKGEAPREED